MITIIVLRRKKLSDRQLIKLEGKAQASLSKFQWKEQQNNEDLMKIRQRITELWKFEFSQFLKNNFFVKHPYEYVTNQWVDDAIASLLSIYFEYKICKN